MTVEIDKERPDVTVLVDDKNLFGEVDKIRVWGQNGAKIETRHIDRALEIDRFFKKEVHLERDEHREQSLGQPKEPFPNFDPVKEHKKIKNVSVSRQILIGQKNPDANYVPETELFEQK